MFSNQWTMDVEFDCDDWDEGCSKIECPHKFRCKNGYVCYEDATVYFDYESAENGSRESEPCASFVVITSIDYNDQEIQIPDRLTRIMEDALLGDWEEYMADTKHFSRLGAWDD